MLAMSLLGALATTHEALHVLDGSAAFAHEHIRGDEGAHSTAPTDASAIAELVHGLAHTWHCCGVTIAVLPVPVWKLLSAPPPPLVSALGASPAPAPALPGLFRPPIR